MNALIEKMRKARESVVEVEGHRFTVRRPTDLDVIEMQRADGGLTMRNSLRFVVGWDLKAIDLVPGGTDEPVEFDPELFMEWVSDQAAVMVAVLGELKKAYQQHSQDLEKEAGN